MCLQEYSSLKATRDTEGQESNPGEVAFNFTSTTAAVGTSSSSASASLHGKLNPSKKIPKEYLTTTPLSASPSTAAPTTAKPTTAKPSSRRKEAHHEPTKRPAKIHHVRKNNTRDDRKTKNGWTLVENLVVPGPTTTTTTTTTSSSATPAPATPDNHRPAHETRAPWERLQVSISPLTKEKVSRIAWSAS